MKQLSTTQIPTPVPPAYGDHESPAARPGPLARALPSLAFYARVARVVLASSSLARKGRYGDASWYAASMCVRRAFERCGGSVSIKGTAHLAAAGGPCVIIGNHMSTAETFLLPGIVRPFFPVTFVVKQGLVEYPVFKHVMRSRDPIVVGRVNPKEDLKAVLEGGQQRLAAGVSIVIFPQRTRTVEFDREAFNTIGVKLARRAGVPVVPVAIKTDAWSNGRLLKDYGPFRPHVPVHIEFGAPLRIEGNEREVHEAVIAFIEGRLRQWGM